MEADPRSSSRKHVVWDEENLAENEKIQAEFAGVTVPEPKTPYHGPCSPGTELEDDMRPLALGDDGPTKQHMTAFDFFMNGHGGGDGGGDGGGGGEASGGGDGEAGGGSGEAGGGGGSNGAPAGASPPRSAEAAFASGKRSERSMSEPRSMTSDGSDGRSSEKRQRFEAARRRHYNMKEALRRGRVLASASGDDTQGGEPGPCSIDEGDEDEGMKDCGSSRLQEQGRPNGAQAEAEAAAGAARNGRSARGQRQLLFDEPRPAAGGDGGGGEEGGEAGQE
ncbi:MAG: hypothetical protein J3K34DRAFT_519936 [Monoraphidium minutum]|nr:MAG: hypothetical protein J3K34DRAFT_519936 [Monoraphidium minutum]